MTAPGEINRRLKLLAPVETADGEGGVTRHYETAAVLWAQLRPVSAAASVSADRLGAALRYAIVIRYRDDVTTRHQLQDGAQLFRVIAAHASADRRFLVIDAEERVD